MGDQIYIHYGATQFDPTKNFPIRNRPMWVKPKGGLWASRIDATFGWKDWNEQEEFIDYEPGNVFKFTIKPNSNIALISTLEDLKKLPLVDNCDWDDTRPWNNYWIDFEKCLKYGVDAIELAIYGEENEGADYFELHHALYGWDCDSIVILNPDIVVQMEG